MLAPAPAAAAEPLIVLLIGPPGGGKGTQAERITKRFGIPPLSTGEVLRAEVKAGTALGKQIGEAMSAGKLVEDSIVNGLVAKRIAQPDCAGGFILDGYPRTLEQARFLQGLLSERKLPQPAVIHLDVPEAELIKRLTARGRADDKPEVIKERLKVYERDTAPILKFYASGNYHHIDGAQPIDAVFAVIERILSKRQ